MNCRLADMSGSVGESMILFPLPSDAGRGKTPSEDRMPHICLLIYGSVNHDSDIQRTD